MQDRPTIDELLDAVQGFLRDDVVPRLEGQPRFHARVAANAIAIVRRELQNDCALSGQETERLAAILDRRGSREALNAALVDEIRSEGMGDPAAVLAHLRQTALEKLSVANPRYEAER
ncbi:DUF6285 domain-containing protein [Minwuia sp.]|uniref:DUF6285 domain-containing protein n=1 Tax=Minwuia sp. TaxID=2493630 RepID=UPI003A8F91E2